MSKEKLENNQSKAIIKDFTKLKNDILEGKLDDKFKSVKEKKLRFQSIKKMIQEEQEKVEDFEKKGVGPAGMSVKEKPKIKKPRVMPGSMDLYGISEKETPGLKKGGEVKKYMGGGSVHKNKKNMITTKGWGASRKT